MELAQLNEHFSKYHHEIKAALLDSNQKIAESGEKLGDMDARLRDIEQKGARPGGTGLIGGGGDKSWGETVVNSPAFRGFLDHGGRGCSARIEVKAISTLTTAAGGALVPPDRRTDLITLPVRRP